MSESEGGSLTPRCLSSLGSSCRRPPACLGSAAHLLRAWSLVATASHLVLAALCDLRACSRRRAGTSAHTSRCPALCLRVMSPPLARRDAGRDKRGMHEGEAA